MTTAATVALGAPTGPWTPRTGAAMPMTAATGVWRSWAVNPNWKGISSPPAGTTSSAPAEPSASVRPASVTGQPPSASARTWAPTTATSSATPTNCAVAPRRPARARPHLCPAPRLQGPQASTALTPKALPPENPFLHTHPSLGAPRLWPRPLLVPLGRAKGPFSTQKIL